MSGMFGDDYYTTNDCDEEKPVFDDDDDIDVIRKLRILDHFLSFCEVAYFSHIYVPSSKLPFDE